MLTAQVWTSVDGTRWESVVDEETVFADSQMNAIVANEQGLIAWGLKQPPALPANMGRTPRVMIPPHGQGDSGTPNASGERIVWQSPVVRRVGATRTEYPDD